MLNPEEAKAVAVVLRALWTRRQNPPPLPGADENTQFGPWLLATKGPHAGQWTWGTCRTCHRALVGNWAFWSDGLPGPTVEFRPYPSEGCHPNRQGMCSVLLGMEEK